MTGLRSEIMSTRKHTFLKTIQELEEEFRIRFSAKPTVSTQSIIDRVRRSLSWLRRAAELSDEDRPPRFVDLWIALNALYGQPPYAKREKVRSTRKRRFHGICAKAGRTPIWQKSAQPLNRQEALSGASAGAYPEQVSLE